MSDKKSWELKVRAGTYKGQDGQEKTSFVKIGTMFESKNGGFSLIFNALPVPGDDGKIWVNAWEKQPWNPNNNRNNYQNERQAPQNNYDGRQQNQNQGQAQSQGGGQQNQGQQQNDYPEGLGGNQNNQGGNSNW